MPQKFLLVLFGLLVVAANLSAAETDRINIEVRVCHHSETCGNSIDDNCDGQIDEGCQIPPATETPSDYSPGGGGPQIVHSAEIAALNAPDVNTRQPAVISAQIKNTGSHSGEFWMRLYIEKNNEIVFEYPFQTLRLDPNESQLLVFDAWEPQTAGIFLAVAQVWRPQLTQKLAEKAALLTVRGRFLFDVRIEELKHVLLAGEEQEFVVFLYNRGESFEDLELTSRIVDSDGVVITQKSFVLAVAPQEQKRIRETLPTSPQMLFGDYELRVTLAFKEERVNAVAPFRVVSSAQYPDASTQELKDLLQQIQENIDQRWATTAQALQWQRELDWLNQRLKTLQGVQDRMPLSAYTQQVNALRQDAYALARKIRRTPQSPFPYAHFVLPLTALILVIILFEQLLAAPPKTKRHYTRTKDVPEGPIM